MRRCVGLFLAVGAALALSACTGKTTGATNITDSSATLNATGHCDSGQACTWYWEYWPAELARGYGTNTPVQGPVAGPTGDANLSTKVPSLAPNTTYRWVFCASPNNGGAYACAGPHGTFGSTTADPPPDYETFTTAPIKALAEAWDGTTWAIQPTPNPSRTNITLFGLSCTSATACTAVGRSDTQTAETSSNVVTLAERWDGTSWTVQPTPNPSGATSSVLSGVSCTSRTACVAVGKSQSGNGTATTLAERWDGTSWAIQPTPNPSGSFGSDLSAVSCTSATACTAAGGGGASGTLAEHWDGTTWAIQPTPNPSAPTSSLSGVSCTSATACAAVGNSEAPGTYNATLAERWDGTTWTIQPTPNPTSFSALSGVSCTSATACTAVGASSDGVVQSLAERWDGTGWTIQPTPNPSGAIQSGLSGVSCTSATACTAAGSSPGSTPIVVAERWDGTTWTIQPTPNPPYGGSLSGVSCTSATACTAVGSY